MIVNPGIRRFLGSAIQRLFNSASFYAPLTHSLALERGAGSPTFTRATPATVTDHEGVLRTAIAGEARFEGARRVRNLLTQTTDTSGANWTKGTVTVSGEVITATAGAGNHWTYQSFTSTSGNKYIASVKAKAGTAGFIALGWGNAATSEGVYFNLTNGAKGTTNGTISGNISGPDDDGYYTCSINKTTPTGNVSVEIHTSDNQAITWSAAGTETVYVKELQLEDITGRADQTTPSEYVSVGVESAPYYHGSMVDGVKCFPTDLSGNPIPAATMLGYLAEGARTNLCLQSNAFTTTWANTGTPTATQNAVGPDGATSAWTLSDNDGAAFEAVRQIIALTAATHTVSVFVKKTTGVQASYPLLYLDDAISKGALCTIDTSNGGATVWTAYTGLTIVTSSAVCRSFNDNFWRVELTFLPTAANWTVYLFPAGTTNATQSTGVIDTAAQGSAVFYGAQVELGSFASSYIATTTLAVARNGDVLTYSSAGNILGTEGWAYCEVAFRTASAGYYIADSAANRVVMYGIGTGVIQSYDGTNNPVYAGITLTNGTVNKLGTSWSAATSRSAMAKDGTLSSTNATFDGDYNFGASIGIGTSNGGVNQPGIPIRNVRIGQRQLSASEMQAVTA